MKYYFCRYFIDGQGQNVREVRWPKLIPLGIGTLQRFSARQKLKHLFMILFSFVFLAVSILSGECQEINRKLVLGVRADAPPFSSLDQENGNPEQAKGYTVDLCKLIAERAVKAGLYCSYGYKTINTANRFDDLKNGNINMLCGASTVTLERMRVADFSLFTFLSGASVMYRKKNIQTKVNKKETINVGVLNNTTTKEEVKRILAELQKTNDDFANISVQRKPEVVTVETHYQGLKMLNQGSIEAYVADREILLALQQESTENLDNADIIVSDDYYTIEPYAIGIQIGNSELRYIANSVLSELYNWERSFDPSGHIFTILMEHFPQNRFSRSLEVLFQMQRISRGEPILEPIQRAKCR